MAAVADEGAVLIANAEALSRIKTIVMFMEARFKVYEAVDADEAIKLLALRGDIGIMLVDDELPGSINGIELARYASNNFGRLRVLVTSSRRRVASARLPVGALFLDRPYHIDRVMEKLKPMSI